MTSRKQKESGVSQKHLWLKLIVEADNVPADLGQFCAALDSQGGFARYGDNLVVGMSLNTFKTISNLQIEGGFARIDLLRRKAVKKLKKASEETLTEDASKKTVRGLEKRNQNLTKKIFQARDELLVSTHCLHLALRAYEAFVNTRGFEGDAATFSRFKLELLSIFSGQIDTQEALKRIGSLERLCND